MKTTRRKHHGQRTKLLNVRALLNKAFLQTIRPAVNSPFDSKAAPILDAAKSDFGVLVDELHPSLAHKYSLCP